MYIFSKKSDLESYKWVNLSCNNIFFGEKNPSNQKKQKILLLYCSKNL